jgi:hypothetical protein
MNGYKNKQFACLCESPEERISPDKIIALVVDENQRQFSAGRYVGTAFKHSWQGAPKGKKILYRQNR